MISIFVQIMENQIFALIILPSLIFISRVADVSFGTLRIVFISQGKKKLAPFVGFFESLIWLLALGQIFSNLTNVLYYIVYALGFAAGNYVGLVIENKISLGLLSLRLIFEEDPANLVKTLKHQGYGLTILTAEGLKGNVKLMIMIIKRKDQRQVLELIKQYTPNAFVSVEQVQSVKGGIFPGAEKTRWNLLARLKKK
ncbi:MAG: DUF2179 domain-containing protein [Promethearchaeota archaeon]|nr:MAG: DUF2179 domain-containing protein [Candidatus Lokiarchaeota archaeon]